ncbi:MAG: RluA family pseudouridine synthase [Chlamydiota bacterium]
MDDGRRERRKTASARFAAGERARRHPEAGAALIAVGGESDGERLDRFLVGRMDGFSRAAVQRLIEGGRVLVNGRAVKAHQRVRAGDRAEVSVPPPAETGLLAEDVPLVVLYEDGDLLVVDKPPGMIVHPAGRIVAGTLVNALLARCPDLSGIGGELKPGIVHRLDKGTSGCIAVAKCDEAHRLISAQFARREVYKEYLAIVHGAPPGPRGIVEGLIARHPVERKRMAVRRDRGRESVTRYEVIERFGGFSWVSLRLHTGRTHQIRVHMAHLGCPVLGDPLYGRGRTRTAAGVEAGRPMLHAWRLGFAHPTSGRALRFEAPIPGDIARVLAALRAEGAAIKASTPGRR